MNRRLLFILLLSFTLWQSALCAPLCDQIPPLDSLKTIQTNLTEKQDSIQRALGEARSLFTGATPTQRDSLSEVIIALEGTVFEVRAHLAEVGGDIAISQEVIERENLNNTTTDHSTVNPDHLYQAKIFVDNLSPEELQILKTAKEQQKQASNAVSQITLLYNQLKSIKNIYDTSFSQAQIDSLKSQSEDLCAKIQQINQRAGSEWQEYFDDLTNVYRIMLDISPDSDRTMVENIERRSREVRSEKTILQQNSLAPNLTALNLERALILNYQATIANAADLTKIYNKLKNEKIDKTPCDFPTLEFGEKVLTIYSKVKRNYEYGYNTVKEIPEIIIPYKGVYYTVRVALFTTAPKQLSTFRDAGPLQLYTTDQGRQSYQVGGFRTYEDAEEGLNTARNIGFKSPAVIAYIDGELSTVAEAREQQKKLGVSTQGGFKVVLLTLKPEDGDTLKELVESETTGKSVLRVTDGKTIIFSVITFMELNNAEEFATTLRENINNNVTVEEIKL